MAKDIPVISKLLRAMILGDYKDALDIVLAEKFDPNEKTQSWGSPILSALITVMSGTKHSPFTKDAKDVFKAIVLHENFDPNATDMEKETSLMHIARFSEYGWLVPFILNKKNVNIGLRNLMGRTAIDIASVHNNVVVRDLLMACNVKEVAMHSPKKKVGLKKKKATPAPTTNAEVTVSGLVANNIEVAFTPEAKENPFSLYHLVKNFINGNYDECLRIANNVHFNPNESDRWDEPALSSLIYYSQDSTVKYDEDKLMEDVLELDIIDMIPSDDDYTIYTSPEAFISVKDGLDNFGYTNYIMSEVTYVADNYVSLDDEAREKAMALIDTLEELDDVQEVYHNLEM